MQRVLLGDLLKLLNIFKFFVEILLPKLCNLEMYFLRLKGTRILVTFVLPEKGSKKRIVSKVIVQNFSNLHIALWKLHKKYFLNGWSIKA